VPSGPSTFRLARTRLPVTAIHTSPLRFVAYANAAAARPLQIAGLVNRVFVVPATGRSAGAVKAALLHQPAVAAVQGAAATTEAVDRAMEQFNEILLVTVTIAAAMSLLIAFNAAAINADERARENATMFAHGVSVDRVVRGGIAEALIIGVLGTAAGLVAAACSAGSSTPTCATRCPNIGGLVGVGPTTYVLAVIAGVVVVALAPLLTVRRLRRTDMSATLRVVE
jgi:putative ABC transport system permease protein